MLYRNLYKRAEGFSARRSRSKKWPGYFYRWDMAIEDEAHAESNERVKESTSVQFLGFIQFSSDKVPDTSHRASRALSAISKDGLHAQSRFISVRHLAN